MAAGAAYTIARATAAGWRLRRIVAGQRIWTSALVANNEMSGAGSGGRSGRGNGVKSRRLLVCDDEPAFGRLVRTIAEDMGYEVAVTTDGVGLTQTYDRFVPTTIILDMVMPEMDGNEVVLWLARRGCQAKLIIITGYTPDYATHAKTLAEFKGLGPVTTLRKPVDIDELRAVLAR
jgi:CheY-like chemotaxis protein